MNIVYFGNNRRGVRCLETLYENGFNISAVVIHHGAPDKRDPASVHHLANKCNMPVYDPENVNSPDFIVKLKELKPELMVLAGYNQILKSDILQISPKGTINLHGGYLPYYRGGSPINWQIINGETTGGCAIIYVDEGIDTGDIIAQELYPIAPDETAGVVIEMTLEIFPRMLIDVLKKIEDGCVRPVNQDLSKGAYYCKRYPQDGQIFWDRMTALQVHNLARGLNGPTLPGAFTFLDGKKIIIWRTRLLKNAVKGVPGRIALRQQGAVIVLARDSGVIVVEIKTGDDPQIISAKDYFKICGCTFK